MRIQQVTLTGPCRVELEETELSNEPLAPHEVLLRSHYSVISPGTELAYYGGDPSLRSAPFGAPRCVG